MVTKSISVEWRDKKSQARLTELEGLVQALLRSAGLGIYIVQEGKFQYVNPLFQDLTGYTEEELLGTYSLNLVHPEDRETVRKKAIENLKGQAVYPYEYRLLKKNGDLMWVLESVASLEYKGKPATVGSLMDITERKQLEEACREAEKRYRAILDNRLEIVYIHDEQGRFLEANDAALERFGYTRDDFGKVFFQDIIHPDDLETAFQAVAEAKAKGYMEHPIEIRPFTKSGEMLWVETFGVILEQWGEHLIGIGIARDITKRKRAEEALRQSEEKYKALFDSSVIGTIVLDAETMKIVMVNQAAAKMFGFGSVEEALGIDALAVILPEDKERVLELAMKHLFEYDSQQAYELGAVTKDGRKIWLNATGARIMHEGRLAGLVSFTDITERRNAEERLKSFFIDLAETVSRALECRDPYTAGHQRGVAKLAHLVGKKMGLNEDRVLGLYMGGLLHDIGKIAVPASILTKAGELSEEEWALIRAHTKQGYSILKDTKLPWPVVDMALHHHERLNGSGYPHGVSGDELSLEVRILAVCDVLEAMSSHRPYRPARTVEEFLEEMKNGRGTKYDASVVDVVVQIVENGEFLSLLGK